VLGQTTGLSLHNKTRKNVRINIPSQTVFSGTAQQRFYFSPLGFYL